MERDLGTQLKGGKGGEGLHCVEETPLLAERGILRRAEPLSWGRESSVGDDCTRTACQGPGVHWEPAGHDPFPPPPSACRTSLRVSGLGSLWQPGALTQTSEKVVGGVQKNGDQRTSFGGVARPLSLALRIGMGTRHLTCPFLSSGLPPV